MFDFSPIPTIIVKLGEGVIYANNSIFKFLGYKDQVNSNRFDFLNHIDDESFYKQIKNTIKNNTYKNASIQKKYLNSDGHSVEMDINIVKAAASNGSKLIIGYHKKTNTRKPLDLDLIGLNLLIEHSNDAIYIVDPSTAKILNCNKNAYKRLKYTYEEIKGKTVLDINARVSNLKSWHYLVKRLRIKENILIESSHTKKDGKRIPVEISITLASCNSNEYFIAIVRDISERKKKEICLWRQANLDPLTNLPNRRIFEKEYRLAAQASESKDRLITMLYLDIDLFKNINDEFGHFFGDGILKSVAERLKSCVRKNDCISRLGGDEFIIVFSEVRSKKVAQILINKVADSFKGPFSIQGKEINICASIGATTFSVKSSDMHEKIRQSDQAMYKAKRIYGTSIYSQFP
jgi:diguanylate cyclase (GGDEF)-like protein/PAS domain S-box-containing protein